MLVPTSQELQVKLDKILEDTPKDLRYDWSVHPLTTAISILLETVRLRALEAIEGGAYADNQAVAKLAGQAQLCNDLADFFNKDAILGEDDDDSN